MKGRNLARWLSPHGVVEGHRRRFRLNRLDLPTDLRTLAAVDASRYELWPTFLRKGSPPWTLVDVGANEGDFVDAVSSLVQLKSVHAFEPLPSCHPLLEQRMKQHKEAHLFRCAVGATIGQVEINLTSDSKLSSVLLPQVGIEKAYGFGDFAVQQRISVPLVTLDEALVGLEVIDLLKLDVQGFELEVFRGAQKVLKRTKTILLEVNYVPHYQGGSTFDEVHEELRSVGFRTAGVSAPYCVPSGPLWADAMFVRL